MKKHEENRKLEEELVPVLSEKVSDLTVEDLISVILHAMNLHAEYRSNCSKAKKMLIRPSRDGEVFDHVLNNPGICKRDLRELLGISGSVMVGSLNDLVASGHLVMTPGIRGSHTYTATGKEYTP